MINVKEIELKKISWRISDTVKLLNFSRLLYILKHRLWFIKIAIIYLAIRFLFHNKKVFFCYGSVSDTFYMIEHAHHLLQEDSASVIMGSKNYVDIFKVYGIPVKRIISINERWCLAIINYYHSRNSKIPEYKNSRFINLNINSYNSLRASVRDSYVSFKQALLTIAPYKNLPVKKYYPKYSKDDHDKVGKILSKFSNNAKNLILINPISYTHEPLSKAQWTEIAKVLQDNGYKVIYNIKNNFSRSKNVEWIGCEKSIEVPAHLLPLLGEYVGLTLARPGGAFDLTFGYSPDSSVLLFLYKNKKIYDYQESSYLESHMKNLLEEMFGKVVDYIELDDFFSPELIGNKILSHLRNQNS